MKILRWTCKRNRSVCATATIVCLMSWCCAAFVSRPLGPRLISRLPIAKDPVPAYTAYPSLRNNDVYEKTKSEAIHSIIQYKASSIERRIREDEDSGQFPLRQDDSPVCRVVTRSDSKIPSACIQALKLRNSTVLSNLDSIYHAIAHEQIRHLQYMQESVSEQYSEDEEKRLVSLTRSVLESAGFQRLSRRDIDLCDALNAGYLLRLSLLPDTNDLNPGLFAEFYQDLTHDYEKFSDDEELLFGGRVLVYWRGYSEEVSEGHLLLPKLYYLQASLVQRSAGWVRQRLDIAERWIAMQATYQYRKFMTTLRSLLLSAVTNLPSNAVADAVRDKLVSDIAASRPAINEQSTRSKLFTFSRYGGLKKRFMGSPNPTSALDPFVVCTDGGKCSSTSGLDKSIALVNGNIPTDPFEDELYHQLNRGNLKCLYDGEDVVDTFGLNAPPMQLLKRVSLGSLVDIFTKDGRMKLFETLISRSKLVEPTYKEVVVIWRPQAKRNQREPLIKLPLWVYDVADMFDIDGLPPKPQKPVEPPPKKLEIRAFSDVPMANLPAVLPKTKLIFRPADAFVFDSITLLSLLLVVGSFKFDNPGLDLLALVSGVLWVIRTFFRYSNKLARYDLLVKTFLTSKLTHRNMGALKYIATEAGSQRALRASLFHTLLSRTITSAEMEPVGRDDLIRQVRAYLDQELDGTAHTAVDLDATFSDLEDMGLIRSTRDGRYVVVRDSSGVLSALKKSWCKLFDDKIRWRGRQ